MIFEMDLKVLRDREGRLLGFEVVPKPHTESEMFCSEFPKDILDRSSTRADAVVKDGRLHLTNPATKFKGECSFALSPEDASELDSLLELRGQFSKERLAISQAPFSLTGGFRICRKTTVI